MRELPQNIKCPCCSSQNTGLVRESYPSISSDRKIYDCSSRFYICSDCGFIFNSGGARGAELEFYSEEYDLHSENTFSEFLVYGEDGESKTQSDAILEFIKENIQLPNEGRMLEVGAGKGLFLKKFIESFHRWNYAAVEPSSNAVRYFKEVLPSVEIHPGTFESSPFLSNKYDFVASIGVIEHVPEPLEFLKALRSVTSDDGYLFIGFPNFDVKPDDLLLYDHLNQLNPTSADQLYQRAGLKLISRNVSKARIWQWDILSPCEVIEKKDLNSLDHNQNIVQSAKSYILEATASFEDYVVNIEEKNFRYNLIFGIGVIGIYLLTQKMNGNFNSTVTAKHIGIDYFIDDSPTLWGSKMLDVEIVGSNQILDFAHDSQVFISASPCYHSKIVNKLIKLGIKKENIFK